MPNALMMRQMEWQTEQKKTQAYDPRTHESGRLTAQKMPLQVVSSTTYFHLPPP
jgi:lipopolysaccharide export system protein LptC